MTDNVYWMVELTVAEDDKAAFEQLAEELIAVVKTEPGTLAYEWHRHEDGTTYYVYERYADSAAAVAHFGNFGKFAERFMSLVQVTSFNAYGALSDELRAAIADWKSPVWTQFAGFKR